MPSTRRRLVEILANAFSRTNTGEDDDLLNEDIIPHLWQIQVGPHVYGAYSFAALQASPVMEDKAHIEVHFPGYVYCGIYDGHNGPEASTYVQGYLHYHFQRLQQKSSRVNQKVLMRAIAETEKGFLEQVRKTFPSNPLIAASGSTCCMGILYKGLFYYCNLGDSRAVIGFLNEVNIIEAKQLTRDDNVNIKEVREGFKFLHSKGNSDLLQMVNGTYLIKGLVEITRSIGDAYLKLEEFAFDSSTPQFQIPGPTRWPLLQGEPTIGAKVKVMEPADKFIILASHGLWKFLTNEEAVNSVHRCSPKGAARKLIRRALKKAATEAGMSYDAFKELDLETRRHHMDDISVIVLFLNHELMQRVPVRVGPFTVEAFGDVSEGSSSQRRRHESGFSTCRKVVDRFMELALFASNKFYSLEINLLGSAAAAIHSIVGSIRHCVGRA